MLGRSPKCIYSILFHGGVTSATPPKMVITIVWAGRAGGAGGRSTGPFFPADDRRCRVPCADRRPCSLHCSHYYYRSSSGLARMPAHDMHDVTTRRHDVPGRPLHGLAAEPRLFPRRRHRGALDGRRIHRSVRLVQLRAVHAGCMRGFVRDGPVLPIWPVLSPPLLAAGGHWRACSLARVIIGACAPMSAFNRRREASTPARSTPMPSTSGPRYGQLSAFAFFTIMFNI